jgi:hypothetical protein
MQSPLWDENIGRLRDSLVAQANRIRAGSSHSTIKGTSLEIVLCRTLREYIPGYFKIGSGQAVNNKREESPQLDVMIYDQNAFPHLAVNEDSSVMVCCESLLAAVECKARWDGKEISQHFRKFVKVESKRHPSFSHSSNAAAYFVVVFSPLNPKSLAGLGDDNRSVGIYTIEGETSWYSPQGERQFVARTGNGLAFFLKDVLFDCMIKGQKETGDFGVAHQVVRTYFESETAT